LKDNEKITLEIFGISEKNIETIVDEQLNTGECSVKWNASMQVEYISTD